MGVPAIGTVGVVDRVRKQKIVKLRKRLIGAKTDADRSRLTGKLHRLGLNSPGQALVKE